MNSLQRARLVWDTLRPLSPSQVGWRLLRSVQRRLPLPGSGQGSPLRASLAVLEAEVSGWAPVDVAAQQLRARQVIAGRFAFVGVERDMVVPDWTGHPVSPLWTYNLHYFDYAIDLAWAIALERDEEALLRLQALVDGWIAATAAAQGPGWAPYPLATRVINWARMLLIAGDRLPREFRERVGASLHHQLRVLRARLEWDIRGNHLQRDLTALLMGALLFDGREAVGWCADAQRWLTGEIAKQVLDDGGHYERSPMYQAIVAMDLLEAALLCRAAGTPIDSRATARVCALARSLGFLTRTDGSLHLFNDAANGIAPGLADIRSRALRLDTTIEQPGAEWGMPDTGYWGLRDPGTGRSLIVDAGPPGPREQPGHAHCDMLSFELDAAQLPFIVDSGVHGYDGDAFREYSRSTRAHNTVTVGALEQSECWATFRVARRARMRHASAETTGDQWRFHGGYSPYYDSRVLHEREITWQRGEILVRDRVSGTVRELLSFVHLHPACELERTGESVVVRRGGVAIALEPVGAALHAVVKGVQDPPQGWYFPRFGEAEPALVLVYRAAAATEPFGYRIRFLEG